MIESSWVNTSLRDYFLLLGDPIEFAGTALNTHNRYRLFHHVQPLKWSDKLSSQANKIAYKMAKEFRNTNSKRFGVPDEETVGENVEKFLGEKFGCDSTAAMKATDKWYQVKTMRTTGCKHCFMSL